jgi:hypothetical protein
VPVYLYDDVKWLPYENTNISLSMFGYQGKIRQIGSLVDKLLKVDKDEYKLKMQKVREIRQYYTYEGILQQIDLFFLEPLGPNGGHLRCERVPLTDH